MALFSAYLDDSGTHSGGQHGASKIVVSAGIVEEHGSRVKSLPVQDQPSALTSKPPTARSTKLA